jgi:diacylglycerol kinase (ATP)
MRAAAILGLGCSPSELKPFQIDQSIEWQIGPSSRAENIDVVLLFGGDGTIHRHLSELVSLDLPVLVVPTGSGNDFARALGLRHVRDSAAAWQRFLRQQDNIRAIDLGVITACSPNPDEKSSQQPATYYCTVAGIGLDAEVARRANNLPRRLRGHGGYALSLAPVICRFSPFPIKISVSDQAGEWTTRGDQRTLLAAFANTGIYGGGMKIAPEAKPDDGQLDVCVIGGIHPFQLFYLFPTVYFGQHLRIREVQYFRITRARVETEHPRDVYADGEFVCRTPVEISIHRQAFKVLTP